MSGTTVSQRRVSRAKILAGMGQKIENRAVSPPAFPIRFPDEAFSFRGASGFRRSEKMSFSERTPPSTTIVQRRNRKYSLDAIGHPVRPYLLRDSTVNSARCVVLVPLGAYLDPGCEEALNELERRGYCVRRVRGHSAIDYVRNQMATDALTDGFDELVWVDSDIAFQPEDVEALRSHDEPFVCGLYPKLGPREFACAFLPSTPTVAFGNGGGLLPILYCGFGFA